MPAPINCYVSHYIYHKKVSVPATAELSGTAHFIYLVNKLVIIFLFFGQRRVPGRERGATPP